MAQAHVCIEVSSSKMHGSQEKDLSYSLLWILIVLSHYQTYEEQMHENHALVGHLIGLENAQH